MPPTNTKATVMPAPAFTASDDDCVGLVVSTSPIVPPKPPPGPPMFLMIAGTRPELGNVHGTLDAIDAAQAVKFLASRPVWVAKAPCLTRRHTAYAAVMLTGLRRLNGAASGPSNLKLVASWRICGTFGTGVTLRFIAVPPIVPPGNGWLKNPAGTVKPPVPFTFTSAAVMPARSAPPGMQPPGFCGTGPISVIAVIGAG